MTIKDALDSICSDYTSHDAVKRPAMGGYMFRYGEPADGVYKLRLRKRANAGSTPVDYAYTYAPATGTLAFVASDPAASPLPVSQSAAASLSGELFGELIADDWQTGKMADFESARVGGSGEEW